MTVFGMGGEEAPSRSTNCGSDDVELAVSSFPSSRNACHSNTSRSADVAPRLAHTNEAASRTSGSLCVLRTVSRNRYSSSVHGSGGRAWTLI